MSKTIVPPPLFPNLDVTDLVKVQRRARRYATGTIVMAAVGLIYMGGSLALINHLFDAQNESCVSRTKAREGLRLILVSDPAWTDAKQAVLDLNLPAKVGC